MTAYVPDNNALLLCGARDDAFSGSVRLRIGAIFIILVSSMITTCVPILIHRLPRFAAHGHLFHFAKFLGGGVIICTAFIHLLQPGNEALTSECVSEVFKSDYPFAFAFSMISTFLTFIVNLVALRAGSNLSVKFVSKIDPKIPIKGAHKEDGSHGHVTELQESRNIEGLEEDKKAAYPVADLSMAAGELVGVAILEFGVIFHSIIIGITLGTTDNFNALFVVIIFHQAFEGLGLGARLALLPLKRRSFIPFAGGLAYSSMTPIGIAIGLAIRNTYSAEGATASYVTGVFDSISSGILLYTGLVDLLGREFVYSERKHPTPLPHLLLNVCVMLLGAALMALLGRWF